MGTWIILERKLKEHHEDGIRWKAFPCLQGKNDEDDIQKTLDIVREDNQRYWIVEERKCEK
jgi:hypothetical protein